MGKICWCGNTHLEKYSKYYNKCNKCNTLVCNQEFHKEIYTIKDENEDLYGENYWKEKMLKLSNLDNLEQLIDLYLSGRGIYWLRNIMRYVAPGRHVVEIGCGIGQLPYLMKHLGYKQTAFELSPEICKYARENLKIDIRVGEISDYDEQADCVIAMDVLEHILFPKEFIREIAEHLKDDGILCFQTPCFAPEFDTFDKMVEENPRFLNLMEEKEHIFLFSKQAICELLNKEGFHYIEFEQAFFGENYDMFLFASKKPLNKITEEYFEEMLKEIPTGRIYRALFQLFDRNNEYKATVEKIEQDRSERLKVINQLQKELEVSECDREARLTLINRQSAEIEEIEKDRAARLDVINALIKRTEELDGELEKCVAVMKDQKNFSLGYSKKVILRRKRNTWRIKTNRKKK